MAKPEDPRVWEQVRELFHAALDLPPADRAAFVKERIDDPAVLTEVTSLLELYPAAESFLSSPAVIGPVPEDPSALRAEDRLGHFEIIELLGAGGMGEVYRARDTRLGRDVAIKVLSPDLEDDSSGRDRFEREALAVSRLSHPHICTLHDVGSADVKGRTVRFLVMELLEGETLAERLGRGALPFGQAIQAALEILDALAAAHAVGIVHRDLKPANIMITRAGVKLLDFGLARLHAPAPASGAPSDDPLTAQGLMFGTLPYMSPEQLRGVPADARADLFAFGVVLYEMLAGKRPFTADSHPALVAAILEQDPPPLMESEPFAQPALDRLVRACLAKNPDERWQHARDVALALTGVAEGREPDYPRPAAGATLERHSRLAAIVRPWRIHLAWAATVAVVALLMHSRPSVPSSMLPPANPRPVVVLMDSPLQGRVYDPQTLAAGGTNADDVSDALRELDLLTFKENTSPMWHREAQVLQQRPDLVISHLSCLMDERVANADASIHTHLFDIAVHRLMTLFGYVAANNPRTKFLVYTRRPWATAEAERAWAKDVFARFPALNGRLFTLVVPGRSNATFRDPATATLLRGRVREILGVR